MDDKEWICANKLISIFASSGELDIIELPFDEDQLDIFQSPELNNPQRHMTSFEG